MAYNTNHFLTVGHAKIIHDNEQAQIDDLTGALTQVTRQTEIATGNRITWSSGYIATGKPGNRINFDTVLADDALECTVFEVVGGEKCYVTSYTGQGGTKACLCAVDANGISLAFSPATAHFKNQQYTVPGTAKYIVVNSLKSVQHSIYRDNLQRMQTEMEAMRSGIATKALRRFDTVANKNIVLLGDSITQGVGSSDYSPTGEEIHTNVYPTRRNTGVRCWGSRLVSLLSADHGCTAVNNGVSQINVDQLAGELDAVIPAGTGYAVLTIGTNSRNSSQANFRTSFTSLINGILAKNVMPFVFSPIPLNGASSALGMGNMQKIIANVCDDRNVPFFPLMTLFRAYIDRNGLTAGDFYADALHPNDRGHNLIYSIVCECLQV